MPAHTISIAPNISPTSGTGSDLFDFDFGVELGGVYFSPEAAAAASGNGSMFNANTLKQIAVAVMVAVAAKLIIDKVM